MNLFFKNFHKIIEKNCYYFSWGSEHFKQQNRNVFETMVYVPINNVQD